jgi:RuvB-like protein 2
VSKNDRLNQKKKFLAGDMIAVDNPSGRISKTGRNFACAFEYDAIGIQNLYVNCSEHQLLYARLFN